MYFSLAIRVFLGRWSGKEPSHCIVFKFTSPLFSCVCILSCNFERKNVKNLSEYLTDKQILFKNFNLTWYSAENEGKITSYFLVKMKYLHFLHSSIDSTKISLKILKKMKQLEKMSTFTEVGVWVLSCIPPQWIFWYI